MTAEIINLRQERKRREREAKAAAAAENRVRFGRTRAEREREEIIETRAGRMLDGHRRELEPAPNDPAADATSDTPAPKLP